MEHSTVVAVDKSPYLIGRSAQCDYGCGAQSVSRVHAEITISGQDVEISDCGSTNGTTVNGEKVTAKRALKSGDIVMLGTERFDVLIAADKK